LRYDNRSVTCGPREIGYRIEGEGASKVVLLHGLNSHSGTWRKTFPRISLEATVVAPSLPGNLGKATSELAELYSDQVSAVCADAGVSGAVVVGNSMGGWVAMRLVSKHRSLVSRIVLEDTAGTGSEDELALESAQIPALIVWGGTDGVFPVGMGREIHSRLSKSELHVVAGAGHVPHWEAPDEFNRVLGEFLRRR